MQETFLPIAPATAAQAHAPARDYIFEPSAAAIFSTLLPSYVQIRVQTAFADSLASEHAARLISMGAATKNAGEMISALDVDPEQAASGGNHEGNLRAGRRRGSVEVGERFKRWPTSPTTARSCR